MRPAHLTDTCPSPVVQGFHMVSGGQSRQFAPLVEDEEPPASTTRTSLPRETLPYVPTSSPPTDPPLGMPTRSPAEPPQGMPPKGGTVAIGKSIASLQTAALLPPGRMNLERQASSEPPTDWPPSHAARANVNAIVAISRMQQPSTSPPPHPPPRRARPPRRT